MVTCHMYFELQSSELGPHVTQIGLSPKCDREKKSDRGMLCVTMCVSGCRVIQWTPRAHLRQALKPKISKNSIFEIRLAARSNSNSNWHLHGPVGHATGARCE